MSVERVRVSAYTIPTDAPEADGTFSWNSTTLVLCAIQAADKIGIGYTYGDKATALLADELAIKCLLDQPAFDIPALHGPCLSGCATMEAAALHLWRSRRLMWRSGISRQSYWIVPSSICAAATSRPEPKLAEWYPSLPGEAGVISSADQRAPPIACGKTGHGCRVMELDPKYPRRDHSPLAGFHRQASHPREWQALR